MKQKVVRLERPLDDALKTIIKETGAIMVRSFGDSALVVNVPSREVSKNIEALKGRGVEQLDPFVPTVRVRLKYLEKFGKFDREAAEEFRARFGKEERALERESPPIPGVLTAGFFNTDDRDLAERKLSERGVEILSRPGDVQLILDLSSSQNSLRDLLTITELRGLRFLEEELVPVPFNDIARRLVLEGVASVDPDSPITSLTGKGEIIAITDSGLDTGDISTLHRDFRDRVVSIESREITDWITSKAKITNLGEDEGPKDVSGHGTHVTGSIIGDGARSGDPEVSHIKGIATDAKIVFQAVEQELKFLPGYYPSIPARGFYGIPDSFEKLFEDSYAKGAYIHSLSFGTGVMGRYEKRCEALDDFVWKNKDFLVVVAAGNNGRCDVDGYISSENVSSPGTAKNCLTVGASENYRSECNIKYGTSYQDGRFDCSMFKHDRIADSIDKIAAFSSRGPAKKNRRKPDLVAPGTRILSTRSSLQTDVHPDDEYAPAKDHYLYMDGTSMATPLVAGSAALVRQHLRENIGIAKPTAALLKAALIHSSKKIEDHRSRYRSVKSNCDHDQGMAE